MQDAIDVFVGSGHDGTLTSDDIASLTSYGIAVNAKGSSALGGRTALHWAAQNRHRAVVTLLLNAGSDPNVESQYGATSVYWGASMGTADVLRELVTRGGDINKSNSAGLTPLIILAHFNRGDGMDRLNVLLSYDALDLDAKDDRGKTAEDWSRYRSLC